MSAERLSDPGLQETFCLSDEEYAALLGDGSDWNERVTQLQELSCVIVGHLNAAERGLFFRSEVPVGAGPDPRFVSKRVPLEMAAEAGGLDRVVDAARGLVSRQIEAEREEGVTANVPEAKKS